MHACAAGHLLGSPSGVLRQRRPALWAAVGRVGAGRAEALQPPPAPRGVRCSCRKYLELPTPKSKRVHPAKALTIHDAQWRRVMHPGKCGGGVRTGWREPTGGKSHSPSLSHGQLSPCAQSVVSVPGAHPYLTCARPGRLSSCRGGMQCLPDRSPSIKHSHCKLYNAETYGKSQ